MTSSRPSFPLGLTLATLIVIAICSALGVWQLQRASWKTRMLADIAAREAAPAQPIGPVLRRALGGADVDFTRVTAQCVSSGGQSYKAGSEGTEWVWRALAECQLAGGPLGAIELDRGIVDASRGSTASPTGALPSPREVTGLLRPISGGKFASPSVVAPFVLAVERETPPLPGVTPAPGEIGASDNLQYVGAYAPTWFGLAGVAACVYAAMLWRRYRPRGVTNR